MNVLSWSNTNVFTPNIPEFNRSSAGIQSDFPVVDDDAPALAYFEAFFDNDLMIQISSIVRGLVRSIYIGSYKDDMDDRLKKNVNFQTA